MSAIQHGVRVLRLKVARERLGMGKTTFFEASRKGSKYYREDFPRKFHMGGVPVMLESDVDNYILAHAKAST
jgi:predicted DNA-binding transcriptional regulator AlpA